MQDIERNLDKMEEAENPEMYSSMQLAVRGIEMMYPNLDHITIKRVKEMMRDVMDNYLFLDVRPAKEYEVSHLEYAINVDPSERSSDILEKINRTEPDVTDIICYCSVGYRSAKVAVKLQSDLRKQNQDTKVHNLRGGIFQWATQNLPMKNGRGEDTTFVHPYSFMFSYLLDRNLRKSTL